MGPAKTQRLACQANDATLPLFNVLHHKDGKINSLRHRRFSPATLTFPRISSKDAATHAAADLTHALLNPTPNSPLTTLGDKQIAALRKLAEIFNKASPPQVKSPPMEHTPETTLDTAHAPPLRVEPDGDITFQPGRAPRRPPQRVPHIIPDYTKSMPPAAEKKSEETHRIPTHHRYNTRARLLQGQDPMENHVVISNTPSYTHRNPASLLCAQREMTGRSLNK